MTVEPKANAAKGGEILDEVKQTAKMAASTAGKVAKLAASKVKSAAQTANTKALAGQAWLTQKLADELRYAADWLSKDDTRVSPEELLKKAAAKYLKKLRKKHNDGEKFGPK